MIRHELSYALVSDISIAFSKEEHWLAYNSSLYYLDKGRVLTFRNYERAPEFVASRLRNNEDFRLISAQNIADVFKQIPYEKKLFNTLNQEVMNEKNLEYLKDNLKYMGFGDTLFTQLEKELAAGQPQFQLSLETEMNKKPFAVLLNFRKSDNSEMYFFNSYHALLKRTDGEVVDQAFYLNKGRGVTAKEAYNLLEGRAVYKELTNKEGQSYHAWIQLDLGKKDKHNNHEVKQFHEKYGYDLPAALEKFPIREMREPDLRDILLLSLQKGNLQAVTFETNGSVSRMFVEANPQYKTVNLYNSELKRVQKEDLHLYTGKSQEVQPGQEQSRHRQQAKEVRQKNGKDIGDAGAQKPRGRKKSMGT